MTKVIAITGCMGSGKTTLAEHLHRLIPGTTLLFEDDFQTMTQMNLLELEQWRNRGSSIGELNLNGFDEAIRQARKENVQRSPSGPKLLIIESQFGRAHPSLADLIDFQIWIEAPLDFCLARKILQHSCISPGNSHGTLSPVEIIELCKVYLTSTAGLLREQILRVRSVCDAVLVNEKTTASMVDAALEIILNRASATLGFDYDSL